jgi:phosphoribosylanthranilate isomerase
MATQTRLPKIKYCGLTRYRDVTAAIESGADAIGLNFYEKSPRYVSPGLARGLSRLARIDHSIGKTIMRVGVFVNASPAEVDAVLTICPLDCIQLHGDETPEWLTESRAFPALQSICLIKAIAWRDCDEDRSTALSWNAVTDARLLGLLVDAFDPVQRGGTGKTARWDLLFPRPKELLGCDLMLAGGLTAENISQAIEIAKPDGVDVASGIELSPGLKDHEKMRTIGKIATQMLHG